MNQNKNLIIKLTGALLGAIIAIIAFNLIREYIIGHKLEIRTQLIDSFNISIDGKKFVNTPNSQVNSIKINTPLKFKRGSDIIITGSNMAITEFKLDKDTVIDLDDILANTMLDGYKQKQDAFKKIMSYKLTKQNNDLILAIIGQYLLQYNEVVFIDKNLNYVELNSYTEDLDNFLKDNGGYTEYYDE